MLHPHSRSAGAAGSAVLLVSDKEDDGREADEQVDDVLHARPLAEDEFYDVPVIGSEIAKRDKPPVEAADDDEDKRDTVQ